MKGTRPPQTQTHLDAFARGVIWGMRLAGMSRADMAEHVQQLDGRAAPVNAIDRVIAKKRASPEWRGEERAREGGRPQAASAAAQVALRKMVFKERGGHKVTVSFCKKRLPALRRVSDDSAERHLHSAGLKWLTRRRMSWAPEQHKADGLTFAEKALRMRASSPGRRARTDGATFFLARGEDEAGQALSTRPAARVRNLRPRRPRATRARNPPATGARERRGRLGSLRGRRKRRGPLGGALGEFRGEDSMCFYSSQIVPI